MKVLVVGGKGFIGSYVCKELSESDADYTVVDLKDGFDICDFKLKRGYYDSIILLAADLGRYRPMYRHNLSIYEWLAKQEGSHIVYASSAAVYADDEPGVETKRPMPPTLYGESKLLGETVIKATQDSYTILRLANVFGSGDGSGAVDAFKRGENKIYGDGLDIRDYVPVETVAHAFVEAALHPEKYRNEVYNISTGIPTTTFDAFMLYGQGEPAHLPAREFDTRYSVLVNIKAVDAGLIL